MSSWRHTSHYVQADLEEKKIIDDNTTKFGNHYYEEIFAEVHSHMAVGGFGGQNIFKE